jgi:hypothetical protein
VMRLLQMVQPCRLEGAESLVTTAEEDRKSRPMISN